MDWKKAAQSYRDEFMDTLKAFLSINSVEDMATASPGRPFGKGVAEALEFMLDRAAADGFTTKNLEGYAGYVEYGKGAEQIGVLAHVDVVPAGDGWTTPPFSPSVRDGRIYARGAIDDKGPALAAYFALKIVKDSGLPVSKRIRLILGTDEESGWLCMKRYRELEKLPEIGFSPDADFPIVHAEKGQINPVLTLAGDGNEGPSQSKGRSRWVLQSFHSGERVNMVPDQASASVKISGLQSSEHPLETLKADFSHFLHAKKAKGSLEQRGEEWVFSLEGKSAHGMEPYAGKNAGLMLASFLHRYPFEGQDHHFLQFLSAVLYEDHYGDNLGLACEDDVSGKLTVNPGVLQYHPDGGAVVKLNIRYPASIKADSLVERFQQKSKSLGWKVQNVRTSNAHYVPKDHPSIRTLQRVYEAQTGMRAGLISSGGATYARTLKYGVAFGPVFPGNEMTAHQCNEYAELEHLMLAMSIYAQAIYELAK
ncbi:dipeptidase PepV [Paenactinomyces guangxiensis]|uniref:Dipeptidase PepV n=1 Tax=Paenactinomyces guangxiensis TaxID=1490290 RepID=A0A7W2A9N8_9BACL|nr:dipeptidase PepV [Paenactinomyces guangxiensis]MBA4495935.1 dipeptidase PepV [Paenactinomyces guangxiensis]MBH8593078.1 dipeptidase PepV [Paenactinomyces guangxiensis]